jgi:hypothetical protein
MTMVARAWAGIDLCFRYGHDWLQSLYRRQFPLSGSKRPRNPWYGRDRCGSASCVPVDCRRFPLRVRFEPGMSSEALYERYTLFGHDPFMAPIYPNGPSVSFPRGMMPSPVCGHCRIGGLREAAVVTPALTDTARTTLKSPDCHLWTLSRPFSRKRRLVRPRVGLSCSFS